MCPGRSILTPNDVLSVLYFEPAIMEELTEMVKAGIIRDDICAMFLNV